MKLEVIVPILFMLLAVPALAVVEPELELKVDPQIEEALQNQVEVLVFFKPRFNETDWNTKSLNDKKTISKNLQDRVALGLEKSGVRERYRFQLSPFISGYITRESLSRLKGDPDIERIDLVGEIKTQLDDSAQVINADEVWSDYNGEGQTICIIDSGVNYTHSALGGCFGNGCKVVGGYDYCSDDANPCVGEDNDPMDGSGHGTNVAGIVASGDSTYKGIANGARLIAIKTQNSTGSGTFDLLAEAIEWCTLNASLFNISVITISLGDHSQYLTDCDYAGPDTVAINVAHEAGIFVSVASGNDGHLQGISRPACASGAISVGAVYDEDLGREPDSGEWSTANCHDDSTNPATITCFTNRHPGLLDLLAPGCRITSTNITGTGTFDYKCGTSQATPHVAGAAALLLEKNPDLTPDDILETLQNTGVTVEDWSRIDVEAALNYLCTTGDWQAGSCGGGTCEGDERYYTRITDPDGCAATSKCEPDPNCDTTGGTPPGISACDYEDENDEDCPL